jgi:uncharacterized membrane protein YgcG
LRVRLVAVAAIIAPWLFLAGTAFAITPGTTVSPRMIVVVELPNETLADSTGAQLTKIAVVPGETINFLVVNAADETNNFYVGTADQLQNDQVTGLPGVTLTTGDTKTFVWVVPSPLPSVQFGSSMPGRYPLEHGDFVATDADPTSTPTVGSQGSGVPAAGPPYPPPTAGQYVYDFAGLFTPETEATVQAQIVAINERTSAGIVVYTQQKPGATTDSTRLDANALIDQWGVGRKGFDDGLAILFNMNRSQCHGQVQLYAGPGFEATYLSNEQRQQIFDDDMLPYLHECDMDGALRTAMDKIDAATTPEHANALQLARQFNAALGLVGAPLVFLALVGAAGRAWLRYGKDPVYLDDPSVLMPAPPPQLTASAGSVIWEGQASSRAWTVSLLDLASRGEMSFQPEPHLLKDKVGIAVLPALPDDPQVALNRRKPIGPAEELALREISALGEPGSTISSTDLQTLAPTVKNFKEQLEQYVADNGWYREPPKKAISRWSAIGTAAIIGGFVLAVWLADAIPMSALLLVGIALIAGGIVTVIIAQYMPARTMAGAMIYAMLAAYRRTLQYTMAQSRSMTDVVQKANLKWLETPDQAVVWGVALGLNSEVEDVLKRSAEDIQHNVGTNSWLPIWYGSSYGYGGAGLAGGGGGFAPGMFSSGGLPDFGGMTAALGTIGVAPSSSGGGGGFGGGGGGGGGGGAGGGF